MICSAVSQAEARTLIDGAIFAVHEGWNCTAGPRKRGRISIYFSFMQARCFPIIVPFHSISLVFSNDVTVEQLALRRVGRIGLGAVADKIDVRIEPKRAAVR